jgi:hypothetical protein
MEVSIKDLRVSFIWTETFLELLQSGQPEDYPYGFLGHNVAYKSRFRQVASRKGGQDGLHVPWHLPSQDLFWFYYLGGKELAAVTPLRAWENVVPLRGIIPMYIQSEWAGKNIIRSKEAYYYPFGVAVVFNLGFLGEYSLKEIIDQAQTAALTGLYRFGTPGGATRQGKLRNLGQELLTATRQFALGAQQPDSVISWDPFSITSVIRAAGVDPGVALAETSFGEQIQRLLEGLSNWSPNYESILLPALPDPRYSLDIYRKKASTGDVLYAGKRGRVVWFPGRFTLQSDSPPLGCYHRNLAIASMHTESLARFLLQIAGKIDQGQQLGQNPLAWCAKNAAICLSNLYRGKSSYRTWSVRAQIDQNDFKPAIDKVLVYFKQPALP